MIVADKNLERYWVQLLRSKGYEVLSISETHPQMPDNEVARTVGLAKGILITEDKDFGALIFAHGAPGVTVIFLRYEQPRYELIEQQLLHTIEKYKDSGEPYFITITEHKVRVRSIQ